MEELLLGLSENAEREQAELNGQDGNGVVLEGDDAIKAFLGKSKIAQPAVAVLFHLCHIL